jgi:hypothetical protein
VHACSMRSLELTTRKSQWRDRKTMTREKVRKGVGSWENLLCGARPSRLGGTLSQNTPFFFLYKQGDWLLDSGEVRNVTFCQHNDLHSDKVRRP